MTQRVQMIEEAIRTRDCHLSSKGALLVRTGKFTGRATRERFIVRREETEQTVFWSTTNQPIDPVSADRVFEELSKKLNSKDCFEFRGSMGGHPLQVHSTSPWHIAFAENMFRHQKIPQFLKGLDRYGEIHIWHAPDMSAKGFNTPSNSEALIILDPARLRVAIIGTAYAGEIKKSAFSMCNFFLPDFDTLPMHASANCLKDGSSSCLLFGLSGTGKTTLSASPDRYLIGDDEILWTKHGLSNLEAGCYAKLIHLNETKEPEIYKAVSQFGAILENVGFDPQTRDVDFSFQELTENTRGSYPLTSFEKVYDQSKEAEVPKAIVFLTADAFGALPAVARLDPLQAQYHFISGYTAKVAGTEMGVKNPKAVFSSCFGEPFMPRHPSLYARLLQEFADKSGACIWLLNTGWTKGGYGKGERFPLEVSRKILQNIQSGDLIHQPMVQHPIFGFLVPTQCSGIDSSWLEIPEGPHVVAVAQEFVKNIERFQHMIPKEVMEHGGPKVQGAKKETGTSAA